MLFNLSICGAFSSGGKLTKNQKAMDVHHYNVKIEIDPNKKTLAGNVKIKFSLKKKAKKLEIDLLKTYSVSNVLINEMPMAFLRRGNKIIIDKNDLIVNQLHTVSLDYKGVPPVAQNPPWEGGITWAKSEDGYPWIGLSCQHEGAYIWFPCKEHPSDKPDSVDLYITVPEPLKVASNGLLEGIKKEDVESLLGFECNDFDLIQLLSNLRKNFKNPINSMLFADFSLPLVSDMLVKVDRMSMANGLEVRSPFLDQDLVELVFSFPGSYKIGFWKGKKILRETFSDRLPSWVRNRKKKGFEIPIANWLTNDLKSLLDDACSVNTLKKINIQNISMVDSWKEQLLSGKKDTSWQLWTLISYVQWTRSRGII